MEFEFRPYTDVHDWYASDEGWMQLTWSVTAGVRNEFFCVLPDYQTEDFEN